MKLNLKKYYYNKIGDKLYEILYFEFLILMKYSYLSKIIWKFINFWYFSKNACAPRSPRCILRKNADLIFPRNF